MIPEDGRVEIDAKIHAGYFTNGKVLSLEELSSVKGRAWEDVDVCEHLLIMGVRLDLKQSANSSLQH